MKTTDLAIAKRENVGKRSTKTLRSEGRVPANLYSAGKSESFSVSAKELGAAVFTPDTYIINLKIDDSARTAIIREVQFHPVTGKILHVDFYEVFDDKAIELTLPLQLMGTPSGVTVGGKLVTKLRKIKVRGIPKDLPSTVDVDVSALELGASIKIEDVEFENIDIVTNKSTAIASVEIPRSLRSATAKAEKA